MIKILKKFFLFTGLLSVGFSSIQAQKISFTGTPYTQDFNTLPSTTSGNNTYVVSGNGPFQLSDAPVNASGMVGWYFAKSSGSGANALFRVDDGFGNSGSTYSYGVGTSTDRSLGSLSSASVRPQIGAIFTNNSGNALNTLVVSLTGIQWRSGASTNLNTLTFEYALGESSITAASATRMMSLDVKTLTTAGVASKLDGTLSENRANIMATIPGINWMNGQDLMIRWTDADEFGTDDGLGLDNFYMGIFVPSTAPSLMVTPMDINYGNLQLGATNSSFDITVGGTNLMGSSIEIISTIPGLTLLMNGTGTGVSMLSIPVIAGSVMPTQIGFVMSVTGTSTGAFSGAVTVSTSGVDVQDVNVTGNILANTPTLVISTSTVNFGSIPAGTSLIKSFTLTGFNLTSEVTVSGTSTVFEVSNSMSSGYGPSVIFTASGSNLSALVYVKFTPNMAATFSNIIMSSTSGLPIFDVTVVGTGLSSSGSGTVTASNPESLGTIVGTNTVSYNNVWRRGTTNKTIDLNFSIVTGSINKITAQFPPQFSFTAVTTMGSAFTNATVFLNGREFTITGVTLTNTTTGVVQLTGVTIPSPSGANLGKFNPIIFTGDDFGPLAGITRPTIFVTVPISNIRDAAFLDANGGFISTILGDSAAIEAYAQNPTQSYASSNGTLNSLQVYLRDNSGALSIFRNGNAYPGFITTGTGIVVKGNLGVFNNANQLSITADRNIILTGNSIPVPPLVVTIENLMLNPEGYEGQIVTIKNVSLTSLSVAWPASNVRTTLNITDDAGVSNTNLLIPYVSSIPNLVFPTTSPIFPSDITGIFTQAYFSGASYAANPLGYQLIPLKIADFVPTVITSSASNDLSKGNVIYPNPMVSNELFVMMNGTSSLKVFDGIGMEVPVSVSSISTSIVKVTFPESSNGMYYISIGGQEKPQIVKVIK